MRIDEDLDIKAEAESPDSTPSGRSLGEVDPIGTLAWDALSVPLGSVRASGTTPLSGSKPLWNKIRLKCTLGSVAETVGEVA